MAEKIAIVSLVSQSPQSLIRFCHHHLDIGVDHIFLYFDKPAENNIDVLDKNNRITCISCTDEHWARINTTRSPELNDRQIRNIMHGISLCREQGIEFVAPIDSDEFIYTTGDFKTALSKVFDGLDAVVLFPYEAIHDRDSINSGPFQSKYFKVLPNRLNKYVVPLFYRRIHGLTDGGFFGHLQGKPLLRVNADIVEYQIHRPKLSNPSKLGKTNALKLLHFDCVLEDEWIAKWRNRLDGDTFVLMRPKRQRQFDEIKHALEGNEGKIRRLYRKYYFHNRIEIAIGRGLGLLRQMDVSLRDT